MMVGAQVIPGMKANPGEIVVVIIAKVVVVVDGVHGQMYEQQVGRDHHTRAVVNCVR